MPEDEMVGWQHQFNGHETEEAAGVCNGQGSLVCCSPWGHKESATTERLNSTELACQVISDATTSLLLPHESGQR